MVYLRTQPSSGEPPRGGKRQATAVVIQTENPSCGPHVLIDRRGYKTRGGYSEGWNASLAFGIEGVALAA
jgi:hypothetical protein